jgi:hypothetical protein
VTLAFVPTRVVVSISLVLAVGLAAAACSGLGTGGTGSNNAASATTTTTASTTTTATAETVAGETTTESVAPTSGGSAKRQRHSTQLVDFTGWRLDDADRWLTNHHLQIVVQANGLPASEAAQFGLVRTQEPAAGTWVPEKSSVRVWQGQQWAASAFGTHSGATPTPQDFDFDVEGGTYSITLTLESDVTDSQKSASMVVYVYQEGAAPESGLQYKISAADGEGQVSKTYTRTLAAGHWFWRPLPYYCSLYGVRINWMSR